MEPGASASAHPAPLAATTRRLLAARFWRSIAQGTLVVDLALYLHALGWSGTEIGAVLSGAGLVGAGFGLLVGLASDRWGRKPFLLCYEGLSCLCALTAFRTSEPLPLTLAILLAGFGRGANGAAGPFAPAEQAWIAETVEPSRRGFVFSMNASLGFLGMAAGALAAMLPAHWAATVGEAAGYRRLFLIVIAGNIANFVLLARAAEQRRSRPAAAAPSVASESRQLRQQENRFLWRLMALNGFNGLAIGLTGPLMSYWFARRFHTGPALIAPVMAATFLVTAAASWASGQLAHRKGIVNVVVWGRSGGLALLTVLPLMPVYWLAAAVHIVRSALNRGTLGARQALVVSAVQGDRRGLASSLNALSSQLPQSVGPVIAGSLMGAGWLVLPFYLAAVLQGTYLVLYRRLFRPVETAMRTAPDRV
ncbi:MAG TPA: MFS transporter [Opitutaceae bacterium]|nr:MFS transporter [Opitutaceae bacterium]